MQYRFAVIFGPTGRWHLTRLKDLPTTYQRCNRLIEDASNRSIEDVMDQSKMQPIKGAANLRCNRSKVQPIKCAFDRRFNLSMVRCFCFCVAMSFLTSIEITESSRGNKCLISQCQFTIYRKCLFQHYQLKTLKKAVFVFFSL